MLANTVYVGRPSKWGNPFITNVLVDNKYAVSQEQSVGFYKRWIIDHIVSNAFHKVPPTKEEIQKELRGKNLACWCPLDKPCHADVLLYLANE